MQCVYSVILRCICITIIAMETQQCIVSSSTIPHKQHNFQGKKKTEHKIRASIFSTTFLENVSFYKQFREVLPQI
jgi:hypothetical protein